MLFQSSYVITFFVQSNYRVSAVQGDDVGAELLFTSTIDTIVFVFFCSLYHCSNTIGKQYVAMH